MDTPKVGRFREPLAVDQWIDGSGAIGQQERKHLLADLQRLGKVGTTDQQISIAAEQLKVISARFLVGEDFLQLDTQGLRARFGLRQ